MSFEITTAFVQQYSSNVAILSQQKGSVLRDAVRVEDVTGKYAYFDQINSTAARQRTTRHGDTPLISTPHARRRVTLLDWDWADLIDDLDKVKTLIDPQNSYALNAAFAMGRATDSEIITRARGTAYTGEAGGTSTVLPSANKIAHASSGLTVAKLRTARKILRQGNVDKTIPLYMTVSAEELDDLLGTTQVTSSDYNTIKALVQGDVDSFMGFKFIHTELLTETSSVRYCIAWAEDGICLGVGANPIGRISERSDKNYSTQVYYSMSLGATRMEEAKVIEVQCYHA